MTPLDYPTFLARKHIRAHPVGFTPPALHPRLFPFQVPIVQWLVAQGRAALFSETGTGKSSMQLEWSKQVAAHTGGRVLIVAPLAVAFQFIDEAVALDTQLVYCRNQAEANAAKAQLIITNYDRIADFDASAFVGVAMDESSILAAYTGKTKQLLEAMFKDTRYKLCATATPAPNDWLELLNQAAWLGIMPSNEAIARWFQNDLSQSGEYTLRPHAAESFWEWVASWAVCLTHPRDIGFDAPGYDLPLLTVHQHEVAVDHSRAGAMRDGQRKMFIDGKRSATDMWTEKAATLHERCELGASIVNAEPDESWIVWASTDEESKLLARLIPGAVEVKGSQKPEEKEARIRAFVRGNTRVLVTKPKIAAQGLNFQHCARAIFVSPSFSWKDAYQGIRRIYRFRQVRPCIVHFVLAETEQNISAAIARKETQHKTMQAAMLAAMRRSGMLAGQARKVLRDTAAVDGIVIPHWLVSKRDVIYDYAV